jgi:hypothetical protein
MKTGINFTPDIIAELADRGSNRSEIVNRDLKRLYTLYHQALLKEIPLDAAEACLLLNIINGATVKVDTSRSLYIVVENACRYDHLDKKWHVDAPNLLQKLEKLTDTQALALVDAAEREKFRHIQELDD